MPFDILEHLWKKEKLLREDNVLRGLKEVLRRGHYKLACELLKYAEKRGLFWYSKLFWQVLTEDGVPDKVMRVSVVKKCQFENITPLHVACINPNVKALKTLLSINPKYDVADTEGYKLIHYAAACEGDGPLKFLLNKINIDINAGN